MPGYKIHDLAGYIAAPIITGVSLLVLPLEYSLVLGATFLLSNYYLSPDLDIDSIMNRRWGVLRVIWYPYRRLIEHRSVLSHSGPLSAAIRMLYLLVWIALPLLFVVPIETLYTLSLQYWYLYVIVYTAMSLADLLHTTLDLIT